jgi:hypothetical protein
MLILRVKQKYIMSNETLSPPSAVERKVNSELLKTEAGRDMAGIAMAAIASREQNSAKPGREATARTAALISLLNEANKPRPNNTENQQPGGWIAVDVEDNTGPNIDEIETMNQWNIDQNRRNWLEEQQREHALPPTEAQEATTPEASDPEKDQE